jgi:Lambda phage tail tube protein, TTP
MAVIGHGSTLSLDTTVNGTGASGDTWTPIGGLTDLNLDGIKIATVDTTDMSTPGIDRTFISALRDNGDLSAKMNLKPGDASQTAFLAQAGVNAFYRILTAGGLVQIAFQGTLTDTGLSMPDDKLLTRSIKIKVSGPAVETFI